MPIKPTHHLLRRTARARAASAERAHPEIDAQVHKLGRGPYRYVVKYLPRGTSRKKTAGYGWRPDKPDSRDFLFTPAAAKPPAKVDLRGLLPACWDQGQLGSCTSFGVAGAVAAARKKQGLRYFEPSHLFIYYNERLLEGSVNEDAGAEVRDGIKTVAKQGVPAEALWPYSDKGSKWRTKPSARAYAEAVKHTALTYKRVTHGHLRSALATGLPVVFGFNVYEAFESDAVAKTGVVPMPTAYDEPIGGHCVLAVGYDDASQVVTCRNSWGRTWGQRGHFLLPYEYVNDISLCTDFWQVTLES